MVSIRSTDKAPGQPPPAPDWLVGLWRRESIRFPDGTADDATRVHWGQTPQLYVDLRIPKDRPAARGRQSFDEFSLDELSRLADQKGFAGHVVLDGTMCSWVRYVDYRPETGRADAGRLRIEGDVLYEEGDPDSILASAYQEIYHRERQGNQRHVALRLIAHQPSAGACDATGAVLVLIDDIFMFARPRRRGLPRAETLRELVEAAGTDRALIHAYLDCEISLGSANEPGKPWNIAESTLPFREGRPLWASGLSHLSDDGGALLHESDLGRCTWRVVGTSLPRGQLLGLFNA